MAGKTAVSHISKPPQHTFFFLRLYNQNASDLPINSSIRRSPGIITPIVKNTPLNRDDCKSLIFSASSSLYELTASVNQSSFFTFWNYICKHEYLCKCKCLYTYVDIFTYMCMYIFMFWNALSHLSSRI